MSLKSQIFKARVNSGLGITFLGTAAFFASLVMWQTAFGYNPLAKAVGLHYQPILEELDKR